MKLTVYQSGKGDCLLLESGDSPPKRLLVDGGVGAAYRQFVAPPLAKIASGGGQLDVVCVSHIDDDHIGGVLELFEDAVKWRVYDHHVDELHDRQVRPPKVGRPPSVGAVWHNGFGEQLERNDDSSILDILSTTAPVLAAHGNLRPLAESSHRYSVVTGVNQGIQLTRRLSPAQLGIDLNPQWHGKMAMARGRSAIQLGKLNIYVIAPASADLEKLRNDWSQWLRDNKKALDGLRQRARADEGDLKQSEFDGLRGAINAATRALVLGDRSKVTAPNLASIMLYVEESSESALLTGDGHCDDVLKGLRQAGLMTANRGLHVGVLKVPHHGSEHNTNEAFCRTITADNYVFCGNGAHGNPHPKVVQAIIDSRIGTAAQRSTNPEADQGFTLWFNNSEVAASSNPENARHMAMLERLVRKASAGNERIISHRFLAESSFVI